jgi:hypothetical protein
MKLGQVAFGKKDISLSAPGGSVNVVRSFDSRDLSAGALAQADFGPGWRLAAGEVNCENTYVQGAGWAQYSITDGYGIDHYYLLETQPHELVITYSDTDQDRFTMNVNPKWSYWGQV